MGLEAHRLAPLGARGAVRPVEAVAQDIDQNCADVSSGDPAYCAPEMKGIALDGVLQVARHKKLRMLFGHWREMAKPLP